MRALFWLLAVFAGAVALVLFGHADNGYVLFVYPPYRLETSLLFFGVAAVAVSGLESPVAFPRGTIRRSGRRSR